MLGGNSAATERRISLTSLAAQVNHNTRHVAAGFLLRVVAPALLLCRMTLVPAGANNPIEFELRPGSLKACLGDEVTITAFVKDPDGAGRYDGVTVTWQDAVISSCPGGDPAGCSFERSFTVTGTKTITATASDTGQYEDDEDPETQQVAVIVSCPNITEAQRTPPVDVALQCSATEDVGTLAPCEFGRTELNGLGVTWDITFDCATGVWRPYITYMAPNIRIKLDWHGKSDFSVAPDCAVDGCRQVADIQAWYICARDASLQYPATSCGAICGTTYIPEDCVREHESLHVAQICEYVYSTYLEKAPELAFITSDLCDEAAAQLAMKERVDSWIASFQAALAAAMAANHTCDEENAWGETELCLKDTSDAICARKDCDACAGCQ